jgi:hypothetical protein
MITVLCFVAAAVVAFWPLAKSAPSLLEAAPAGPADPAPPAPPAAARRPTFRQAIDSLAYVRGRLAVTEGLDDKAKAAIDTLTLALVAGSDKE